MSAALLEQAGREWYSSEIECLRLGKSVAPLNSEEESFLSRTHRAGISGSVCPLRDTRTTSLPQNSTTTAAT